MTLSIRIRLTIWYTALVACVLVVLGFGIFFGASHGLQRAADKELTSGIDGVQAFLLHKLGRNEMNDLNDELREHSALLPRSKMFRVSDLSGAIIYQPDTMKPIPPLLANKNELLKRNVVVAGQPFRTTSRIAIVGPYTFRIQVAVDQTAYASLMEVLGWLLLLSVPGAGILAAITGYWMSGRALSPMDRITETASSIDAASLSRRLPLRGTGDELDRLSTTINRMLDRIASAYERIGQFTADASHELRSPVALIRSNAELLLMGPMESARLESGLKDILSESEYMTRLIGDLLTLARHDAEKERIPMELFELGDSIDGIVARARAQAATRQISIETAVDGKVIPVRGNQGILERVLMILVDNAIRYTPPGGRIWITTWTDSELCGFTVRDTGVGIAREDHERIFERFYRVGAARTPRDGASGLGLSIAKNLVDLHGGTIRVESEPGQGASFRVALPRIDVAQNHASAALLH